MGGCPSSRLCGWTANSHVELNNQEIEEQTNGQTRKDIILRRLTEMRPKYQELFSFYDHDHDGLLGKDEFRYFFQAVLMLKGYTLQKAEEEALSSYKGHHRSDNIFKYYSPNITGRINFNQFWTHTYTDNLIPRDEHKLLKIQQLLPTFQPPPAARKRLSRPMSMLNVNNNERIEIANFTGGNPPFSRSARPQSSASFETKAAFSPPSPEPRLTSEHLAELQMLATDSFEEQQEKELVGHVLQRDDGNRPQNVPTDVRDDPWSANKPYSRGLSVAAHRTTTPRSGAR